MKNKLRNKSWLTLAAVLVLALSLAVGALAGGTLSKDEINAIVNTTTDETKVTSPIMEAANSARKSVVGVKNYQIKKSDYYVYGWGYYNVPDQGGESLYGTGSGVVVSKYGHILTNNHVIKDAVRVSITYEGKEIEAEVVASDAALDLAVLLAPGLDLPAAPLGNSDSLQVGEYAIVVGNPLGEEFERTVTVGFVSALSREVENQVSDRYGRRATVKNQMIQVDAAINQGNSGGGMFNTLGQLQGIPSLKYDSGSSGSSPFDFGSRTASIDNIGMCVPINAAKPMLEKVLLSYDANAVVTKKQAEKEAPRPRLGVTIRTLSQAESTKNDGVLPSGAYVINVEAHSPAEAAGIKVGDIIVEVQGNVVNNATQLIEGLKQYKEGDQLDVKVFRSKGTDDITKTNTVGESEYLDVQVTLRILDKVDM